MTWATFITIWCVSGFFNGLYKVRKDWYQHKVFESSRQYKIFETTGLLILGTITGFVGIAVTIWEDWINAL